MAGIGGAWIGKARHGLAWIGKAWAVYSGKGNEPLPVETPTGFGQPWTGMAGKGPARLGKELATASFTACCEWECGLDWRGIGTDRLGMAWRGKAMPG